MNLYLVDVATAEQLTDGVTQFISFFKRFFVCLFSRNILFTRLSVMRSECYNVVSKEFITYIPQIFSLYILVEILA